VTLECVEEGVWHDAFNSFQNIYRIHVEQAFGIFVKRFCILWCPLEFYLPRASPVVSASTLVQNSIIDIFDSTDFEAAQSDDEKQHDA
jgi:hypothetical protein